jgi:hypothetical protein
MLATLGAIIKNIKDLKHFMVFFKGSFVKKYNLQFTSIFTITVFYILHDHGI